eukprot:g436.t1
MARPEEKKAAFGGLSRLMRYRLMIPIHRNRQDPRPAARGVAVGLFFALMPTVGIQLALLGLFWAGMRWLRPQWRFNLIVAGAWIWVTNILTIPNGASRCSSAASPGRSAGRGSAMSGR